MNQTAWRELLVRVVLGTAITGGLAVGSSDAQTQRPHRFIGRPSTAERNTSAAQNREEDVSVRLNFLSKDWASVLDKVAESTGSTLVADRLPTGNFSRQDFRSYSRTEAVRILNEELVRQDYRLLEKGRYLVLINLAAARPEYRRPITELEPRRETPVKTAISDIGAAGRQRTYQRSSTTIRPRRYQSQEPAPQRPPSASRSGQRLIRRPGAIRQLAFQDDSNTDAARQAPYTENAPDAQKNSDRDNELIRQSFQPRQRTARYISSTLYNAFKERAAIVDEGPDGLPAMQVFTTPAGDEAKKPRSIIFVMAVDVQQNMLIVEGPRLQVERVVRLLQRLDVPATEGDESTRVVATDKNAGDVAASLQPNVDRMADQNNGGPQPQTAVNRQDAAGNQLPDLIGGIRGDVSIEAMEDLGVVILKGNQPDVDAVMEIIKQIETLSAAAAPDIHLRMLENIDGQALAELLTTVYEQLNEARGQTQQQQGQLAIFAVGRPNAVLIMAPTADLESILALIDELDRPVAPQTSFAVFRIKHGIASLIEQKLEEFYSREGGTGANTATDRPGLSTRIKIVTDARTNSLIILAQPNDLKEVEQVIAELDSYDSGAVNQVEVFELRHAVAEELATTISTILQSVTNPPTLGQGQITQAFLGVGGGTSSQELREVRSAILEYLVKDGEQMRKVRSGIIADIRVTGDSRSNTIVVTAPQESMELIAAIIKRLDKPASSVATIKHFTLKNADATSTSDLLNELFGDQTTTQGTQVGVQLAGAENASSVVPLRFSVDVRTNSIVAVGTAEALEVVEALIFRLDDSDIRQRQTTIIRMKNAPAADIATAVTNFLQQQSELLQSEQDLISAFEFVDQQVIIQAEEYTNSLLISATPRYFEQIREMVLKLDAELPQVVIQTMIVEVALEDDDEFGLELGLQDSILFGRGMTGTSAGTPGFNFNSNGLPNVSTAGAGSLAGQALSTFGVGRTSDTLGFGGLVLSAGNESVSILLRALAANRNIEILSRPQIRTLDNRPALIRMVREQQIINGFNTNQTTGALNPVLDLDDAGITLSVTPTISPDGNILISLTAEKSQFIPGAGAVLSFDDQGNVLTRGTAKDLTQAETTVVVADEQTIVLGGLITKTDDTLTRKVPWLGDIPYVGQAFRFDSHSYRRTELLIFLTPRIIKNDEYNETHKQIEASRIHFTESVAEEIHGPLYGIPSESGGWKIDAESTFPLDGNIDGQLPMPLPVPGLEGQPMSDVRPMTPASQRFASTQADSAIQQAGYTRTELVNQSQQTTRSRSPKQPPLKRETSFSLSRRR
ncbi:MAG: secretin N-terminal domain-containing protein [Planctomycetota bacterium]|jgi:type II secretory pathway component GspD/PulD (secretin)